MLSAVPYYISFFISLLSGTLWGLHLFPFIWRERGAFHIKTYFGLFQPSQLGNPLGTCSTAFQSNLKVYESIVEGDHGK